MPDNNSKIVKENVPELLKLREVANMLKVSVWTLRKWDNNGRLKAVRIGTRGDRRYKKADVLKLIKKGLQR